MNPNFLKALFPLTSALLLAQLPCVANAGAISGGGGSVVACRDSQGRLESAELLDLWEGRKISKLAILEDNRTVKDQVESALEMLKGIVHYQGTLNVYGQQPAYDEEAFKELLRWEVRGFFSEDGGVRRLSGVKLRPLEDLNLDALPANCAVEQAVSYFDRKADHILVSQDLVAALSPTSEAALYVHEALYKILRKQSRETNSARVRKAVALAFAGQRAHKLTDLLPSEVIGCTGGRERTDTKIFIYESIAFPGMFSIVPQILSGAESMDYVNASGGFSLPGRTVRELSQALSRKPGGNSKEISASGFDIDVRSRVDNELRGFLRLARYDDGGFKFSLESTVLPDSTKIELKTELNCQLIHRDSLTARPLQN